MATIRSSIEIQDRFSSALSKLDSGLGNAGKGFDSLKGKLGGNIMGGLSKGIDAVTSKTSSLGSAFKSMLGANVIGNGISNALGAVKNEIGGLIGDLGEASAVWKTFEGNMANMGKGPAEIASVKKQLQDYATATIYSASDMSSTYSQLAAVGTKNTTELVKGFGGLAAAAPEPAQAMKTLSQQATQMAALPTVQWADFKLMLQQTPAGIAAVAKTMGKTTSQLVQNIQDGTVKTQDFFNAITKTGTSGAFTKMATEYKTVGQAMDGLREGVTNKLQGAFDRVSKVGINVISSLSDKIASINFDQIADNAFKAFATAKKWVTDFWSALVDTGAVKALSDAWGDVSVGLDFVKAAFNQIPDGKKLNPIQMAAEGVGKAMKIAAGAISAFGKWLQSLTPEQLVMIKDLAGKAVKAFIAWKVAKKTVLPVVGIVAKLASKLSSLGKAGKGAESAAEKVGSLKQMLAGGLNFGIKMAGIALVVASLALLAKSMQGIANAGPNAVANMAAFGGVVGGLAIALGLMGKKLQASASGIAVFAGAVSIMALAMVPLAKTGDKGITALAAFGVVVGGLAVVLGSMGSKLQSSMAGIVVFGAAVSVMALAMAPLAATGTDGAIAMAVFGLVIAGLVAVFAIFGTALNAAIPGMIAFGLTAIMVGFALQLAAPFIRALPPVIYAIGFAFVMAANAVASAISQIIGAIANLVSSIANGISQVVTSIGDAISQVIDSISGFVQQVGDTISQIVDTISNGFSQAVDSISNGISQVVDSVGNAISGVLDSIAGIFDSMGNAALNAGRGLSLMASGIKKLVDLPLGDLIGTLGAVAIGLGKIGSAGPGVAQAGQGMMRISNGSMTAVSGVMMLVSTLQNVQTQLLQFGAIATMAVSLFVAGLTGGIGQAMAAARSLATQSVAALRSGVSGAREAGSMIGAGLAAGMTSQLGAVTAAADALVAQADKAVRAKADIHSPSKLFGELGKFMSLGAAQGITDNLAPVAAAGSALSTAAYTGANSGGIGVSGPSSNGPSYAPSSLGLAGNSSTTNNNQSTSRQVTVAPGAIVVNAATAQDGESIVRTIEDYLRGRADAGLSS